MAERRRTDSPTKDVADSSTVEEQKRHQPNRKCKRDVATKNFVAKKKKNATPRAGDWIGDRFYYTSTDFIDPWTESGWDWPAKKRKQFEKDLGEALNKENTLNIWIAAEAMDLDKLKDRYQGDISMKRLSALEAMTDADINKDNFLEVLIAIHFWKLDGLEEQATHFFLGMKGGNENYVSCSITEFYPKVLRDFQKFCPEGFWEFIRSLRYSSACGNEAPYTVTPKMLKHLCHLQLCQKIIRNNFAKTLALCCNQKKTYDLIDEILEYIERNMDNIGRDESDVPNYQDFRHYHYQDITYTYANYSSGCC